MENRANGFAEIWNRWNPDCIKEGDYFVTKLLQDIDGTKIVLSDDATEIEVFFDGLSPIVRSSEEGIRMRTWGEVQLKYGNKYFFRNWFLYRVENSKLSLWAEEESCGFYEKEKLKHFCIVTSEDMIDVLSMTEPIISAHALFEMYKEERGTGSITYPEEA